MKMKKMKQTKQEKKKSQTFKLNLAQKEALTSLDLVRMKGTKKGVAVLPTGTGKTILSIQDSLKFKGNILFCVHNIEILNQTIKAFKPFYKDMDYGVFNGIKKDSNHRLVFATAQTLGKHLSKFDRKHFDYIIIDEVHHYQAKTYKTIIEYFTPKFLLGLTATPYRTDNKDVFDLCGEPVYIMNISKAIKLGLLCKLKYWFVDNNLDFSKVEWKGNKYNEKDLNREFCIEEYDRAIYSEWVTKAKDRKTIMFCASTKHAKRMFEYFNKQGIKACAVHSAGLGYIKNGKPIWRFGHGGIGAYKRRSKIIQDYKDDKYQIICVMNVFNEGVDIPNAECVMMLRPTQSSIIFTQQIGRGLRTAKGKKDLLVLDFVGNCQKCDINLDVLSQLMGLDIIEYINKHQSSGKEVNTTPIEILNNGCSVRLRPDRIKVLKPQPTREDIIREYFNLKDVLKGCKTKREKERKIEEYKRKSQSISFVDGFLFNDKLEQEAKVELDITKTHSKPLDIKNTGFVKSTKEKDELRVKVISKISKGDKILILESPQLLTLKEIVKQGKEPSLIVIPNNKEYEELRKSLLEYKTDLNIHVINTSALQYLAHCDTTFNFMWLDYCGALCHYKTDLKVCLKKHRFSNTKLILTFNVMDLSKKEHSYYYTDCINYVLKSDTTNHFITLLEDISYRYKSNMYSVGFEMLARCGI